MRFFKVGEIVRWTSQSSGNTRTKQGPVVRVLGEGEIPTEVRSAGGPRDHESYVVRACVIDGTLEQSKRTRLYWPKVKNLRLLDE